MNTLTRTVHVLDHQPGEGRSNAPHQPHVRFTREPDEPGDIPVVVDIPWDLWVELGGPDERIVKKITVTIEPDDLLNEV